MSKKPPMAITAALTGLLSLGLCAGTAAAAPPFTGINAAEPNADGDERRNDRQDRAEERRNKRHDRAEQRRTDRQDRAEDRRQGDAADSADLFDLQAHRGGQGLYTESKPEAFANALELGVSTLELDTQVTADGAVVITHDRQINPDDCRDTGPVTEVDAQYPYAGKYVTDLTLDQVLTLECGYQQDPAFPEQQVVTGPMMQLEDLFELVRHYEADDVVLNIETKVEAGAPDETAPRDEFVRAVLHEIDEHDMEGQVTIQSFDWGALELVEELAPEIPRVALTNYSFLEIGQPGASPWLGGLDADDFNGDLVDLAEELGVDAISPVHGIPEDGAIGESNYLPYTDHAMVQDAHAAGLDVIPWTVDDRATMEYLIDIGVDGIITDRPAVLRDVMDERGMKLPTQYRAPGGSLVN